ncbi:LysR family transcriptional regulator [Rhodoferax sp. TBRC 17198]|uniref:LysR family transcriptional regulator n=1 Tax=Rhodoferax potami TaxID=3068338 RepID=UPI0028BEF5F2|nr:LysR family transcriptional regulator [Rhodoferax sp. TBRC 17198]MDT7522858.1 LysR family transcriptional regulator [Rhodoferax sp. TBRC 17198]
MQDTNDMLYFAEVVERGGFAAAGRHLGIPKSKLSRRVAELEARLGVRLLQRTTRKLSVTEVGEVYLRHCIAMRDAAEAAAEAVEQVQTEPRGTIRIACPVTLAQSTVGPIMALFLARHPLVKVDMRISNRVVDLVEEGVDVALRVRTSLDDSGSLVVKKLGESNTVLVASPLQLARQGQPASINDLAHMDTISMSAIDGRASLVLLGPGGATHTLVHQPRYVADDLLTLKFAALHGTGMCFLPDYMCRRELEQGRLVHVLPGWAPPRGIFHAVYPSRRGMVPAVRRFLDFLGEHTSNEGMPVLPAGCPSID